MLTYRITSSSVVGTTVVVGFTVVVATDVVTVVNVHSNENCGRCICRTKIITVVNTKYTNSFHIGICNLLVRHDV